MRPRVYRVGPYGRVTYDPLLQIWTATSTQAGLENWAAERDTLAEAEAALADAHVGDVLPEDVREEP